MIFSKRTQLLGVLNQSKINYRKTGIFLIVIAILLYFGLGAGLEGYSTFKLSRPRDPFVLPNLIIPAESYIYISSILIAFFGVRLLFRKESSYPKLIIAITVFLSISAFLVWSASGKSLSLTGMLQATIVRAIPIALAALAGVLSERVAVINIGIEGMLLAGAFVGAVGGSLFGGFIGLVFAIITGGLFGLMLAILVVTYKVDQIIAGVAINIFVLGLTSFLTTHLLKVHPTLNDAPVFRPIHFPLLSDLPILGPTLFQHNIFIYGTLVIIILSTYYLFHTANGLRARAVGEHPKAADTLGLNVYKIRYTNVILGGMVAGLGGAWFTLGSVGRFDEGMTGGRGFIGLAAMIFGRWHPVGALLAALVFGFADSLQQKLAILQTPIPSEFLAMAPYLVTIVVVAGLIGKARPPAAIGKPYNRDR